MVGWALRLAVDPRLLADQDHLGALHTRVTVETWLDHADVPAQRAPVDLLGRARGESAVVVAVAVESRQIHVRRDHQHVLAELVRQGMHVGFGRLVRVWSTVIAATTSATTTAPSACSYHRFARLERSSRIMAPSER